MVARSAELHKGSCCGFGLFSLYYASVHPAIEIEGIGVLRNGLNLMNVNSYIQQVIVGVVILVAVLFDQVRSR